MKPLLFKFVMRWFISNLVTTEAHASKIALIGYFLFKNPYPSYFTDDVHNASQTQSLHPESAAATPNQISSGARAPHQPRKRQQRLRQHSE